MANIIDVEIKMKIITKKQKHRANYENVENLELVNFSEFQSLFNMYTIPILIILFFN